MKSFQLHDPEGIGFLKQLRNSFLGVFFLIGVLVVVGLILSLSLSYFGGASNLGLFLVVFLIITAVIFFI